MSNSYEEMFNFLEKNVRDFGIYCYPLRSVMTYMLSWAIPNDKAIETICKYSPIIEVGSGRGYWARQIQCSGGVITCLEVDKDWEHYFGGKREKELVMNALLPCAKFCTEEAFMRFKEFVCDCQAQLSVGPFWARTTVTDEKEVYRSVGNFPGALFLCWPPYDDPMASNCLKAYKGNTLIFIGESKGGCTANYEFFRMLVDEWEQIEDIYIPHWPTIYDSMSVYHRK